jgi:uncharacterized cupin superfamily protein
MSRKAFVRRAGSAQRLCKAEHSDYAYEKRVIVGKDDASHMDVSVYEIPPGKAAYPYHYHAGNEEVFFILSGAGLLRTPEGERTVTAGDFLYFPNNENGAHKLMNASQNEPLVYVDFDTRRDPEVVFYPDSDKVGILGDGKKMFVPVAQKVDYYDGE